MSGENPQPLTRRELRERRQAAEAARARGGALPETSTTAPAAPLADRAETVESDSKTPASVTSAADVSESTDAVAADTSDSVGPITRRQRRIEAAKKPRSAAKSLHSATADETQDVDTSHVDLSKLKQGSPVTGRMYKIREKARDTENFVAANDEDVHDADPQATPDQAQKDLFNTGLNSPDTRSVHVVMPQPAQRNFASEDEADLAAAEAEEEFGASKARFESRAEVRRRQLKPVRKDVSPSQSARARMAAAAGSSATGTSTPSARNSGTPEPFQASLAQGLEPLGFMDGGGARARRQFVISVAALSVGLLTFIVGLTMILTR
ncbi:hypothetical protein [Neomicrococcus aestuarii]|uniref:Uncharacterized protein n=1 Tax=Neomicrococcus aestuarii TaxID=556325 RepID=A0A1L2ZLX2_9MICC|nr:hypothetical protein [Neomicrococcus aestuarii]APF40012.1 hypothetical protein BHE16_02125 [Neomicrococcus aestuarii]